MFIKDKSNNTSSNFQLDLIIFSILLTGLVLLSGVALTAESNPHRVVKSDISGTESCLSCHISLPETKQQQFGQHILPDMTKMKKDALTMCTDCHDEDGNSHIVGVTPEYSVPVDLPLSENMKVNCLTCHYVHGSLKSDSPMASVSAMDRLFNRERLKKSFLLRRNNSNGDLCLACHKRKE